MSSQPTTGRHRPLVAGVVFSGGSHWFEDLVLLAPGLEFAALDPALTGGSTLPNPYQLPLTADPDVVLLSTHWLRREFYADQRRVAGTLQRIRRRARALILCDSYDGFSLSCPPAVVDLVDIVLKAQGVYEDRDLYNWRVGTFFPGGNWSAREQRRAHHYRAEQLDKIRLSIPLFLLVHPAVTARVRALKPWMSSRARWLRKLADQGFDAVAAPVLRRVGGRGDAYFAGSLTHIQRVQLIDALRAAGLPTAARITNLPDVVFGTGAFATRDGRRLSTDHIEESDIFRLRKTPATTGPPAFGFFNADGPIHSAPDELAATRLHLEELDLAVRPRRRYAFFGEMAAHAVALAPAGYGELSFRHAEAWWLRRTLVCQDVSHVEMLYRVSNDFNAFFIRPDLADAASVLERVLGDRERRLAVARNGHAYWRDWISQADAWLERGVTDVIREVADQSPGASPEARGTTAQRTRE